MIIKTVYKTKTVYRAYTKSSVDINPLTRTVSIGSNNIKIHKSNTAYVMNNKGTTLGILRGS